jgi:cyclase
MNAKHFLKHIAVIGIVVLTSVTRGYSQQKPAAMETGTKQIDKDLFIMLGGGGNSGILVTDKFVVVIDTKMGADADTLYDAAMKKAGNKKIIVINTHYHGDHTKGNYLYKGSKIYIGNYGKSFLEANLGAENMPTDMVDKEKTLNLGNEVVHMVDLGRGHTYHDMVVYLEKRNVLFTGDLVFNGINPVLKKESGANIDSWIKSLDEIMKKWGKSMMVPGHGPVGDRKIAESMKQYFEDMKKAAADPAKEASLKEKYKDWFQMPNMASTDLTIKYIRENP